MFNGLKVVVRGIETRRVDTALSAALWFARIKTGEAVSEMNK